MDLTFILNLKTVQSFAYNRYKFEPLNHHQSSALLLILLHLLICIFKFVCDKMLERTKRHTDRIIVLRIPKISEPRWANG